MSSRHIISLLATLLASCATVPSNKTSNPLLEERLRNAQVTEKSLSSGTVLSEVKFAGSLQPNFHSGCIPIGDVSSKFNPPTLIYAARQCIQEEDYRKAWALFTTANGFAYYDLKRLADLSTQGALSVLVTNAFSDLPMTKRDRAQKVNEEMRADPEQVKAYCAELTRIGPPTYEPNWAILHGIGAYQEPRNGHYLANVDTQAIWKEVREFRCTPQKK